jgi:hypothetical protein
MLRGGKAAQSRDGRIYLLHHDEVDEASNVKASSEIGGGVSENVPFVLREAHGVTDER